MQPPIGCHIFARASAAALVAFTLALPTAKAEEVCQGCSCKCGPGFRLPNGRCASWIQHWHYMAKGGYPVGTVDELPTADKNTACPPEEIIKKRKAG